MSTMTAKDYIDRLREKIPKDKFIDEEEIKINSDGYSQWRGGQGTVRTGEYKERIVAVKQINDINDRLAAKVCIHVHYNRLLVNPILTLHKAFSKETLFLLSIDCINIVTMLGVVFINSIPSIVLEWADHGSLFEYLRKCEGSYDILEIVSVTEYYLPISIKLIFQASGVAKGLQHLHNADIVHGDLKSVSLSRYICKELYLQPHNRSYSPIYWCSKTTL